MSFIRQQLLPTSFLSKHLRRLLKITANSMAVDVITADRIALDVMLLFYLIAKLFTASFKQIEIVDVNTKTVDFGVIQTNSLAGIVFRIVI